MKDSRASSKAAEYPAVYRSLMAVGLLGAVYKQHDAADEIAEALELTLADPLQFRINRAIAHSIGGDARFAGEKLGEHLDNHPQDDGAKVVLAVSKMLAGDDDWESLLESVLASSADQVARQAARQVRDFLSKRQ